VRHAAFAAPQVVEQNLPHDSPPQARPPAQCRIDVGDAEDTLADEVVNLAHYRRLQAIGNVAGQLFVEADGALADRGVELRRTLDRVFRGL
jgi:hypothetical protein